MKLSTFLIFLTLSGASAAPRVLPEGQLPKDQRLEELKDLHGHFPFTPSSSLKEWEDRAERIRQKLRVSVGLFPEPKRTALNAKIYGKLVRDGFSVEKVYFETLPGFFLTGSLYRPTSDKGKRPGILCPHGHWNEARFYDCGIEAAKQQIALGAESDLDSARNPIQARCVQLARLGCTVLQYDMLGYCDNDQISYELAHRFSKQRLHMIGEKKWGLFSPQAESHLQSIMMLQTWNSMRAVDFLESLDEIDPQRIAVTGASGGGTQSFVLAALDPRISVAMPAVMVSTGMQGGCTCENSTLMRIDEGNVAFAALFAPKPLGLTSANDWTKNFKSDGFPQLQQTYQLTGSPQNLMLHDGTEFEHNYNLPSRQAMYRWFAHHLHLESPRPDQEQKHQRLTEKDLTVWNENHPKPAGGEDFEKELLSSLAAESQKHLANHPDLARKGWEIILDKDPIPSGQTQWQLIQKKDRKSFLEMTGFHNTLPQKQQVPALWLYPKSNWNQRTVIWLSPEGKAGLYDGDNQPIAEVKHLLATGHAVCGLDLFLQGEFLAQGEDLTETRRVDNTRESASYTLGYNQPLFVNRLRDIINTIHLIQADPHQETKIDLVGIRGAGHWAAAANFLAGDQLERVVIETDGFEFMKIMDIRHPDLLPGAAKYGDLDALLKLAQNKPWIVDQQGMPTWFQ